jgi:hypothetical protein
MPFDYTPPPAAYVAYEEVQQSTIDSSQTETTPIKPVEQAAPVDSSTTALSGSASYDVDKVFNAKVLWGPIGARLVPSTKKTFSKLLSRNIADLSEAEYEQLRYLIEYIATNPASKQRVFDLTGFNDGDLAFAEKYFRKYESRGLFSKLVEFALATSSNGKVSKQVSGIVQFVFETGEINGNKVADDFKYKLLRGIPDLVQPIWQQVSTDCQSGSGLCSPENQTFLDLNVDNKVDSTDLETANSSFEWLKSKI